VADEVPEIDDRATVAFAKRQLRHSARPDVHVGCTHHELAPLSDAVPKLQKP
jgi:hypothetical protein